MTQNERDDLITDLLIELRAIRELLEKRTASEARSSVEVKTSTRGVDVAAKSYDGSPVFNQVEPAVRAYFEAVHQVEHRLMGNTTA